MPQNAKNQNLDKLLQKSSALTSSSDSSTVTSVSDEELVASGVWEFEASWGKITVDISEDFLQAHLLSVAPSDDNEEIATEAICDLLGKNHFTPIAESDELHKIPGIIAETESDWSGRVLFATGNPPGDPGGIDFIMFGENSSAKLPDGSTMQIKDEIISFSEITNFFSGGTTPGSSPGFLSKTIKNGEIVAERLEPIHGTPGRDIYGRPVKPPPFYGLLAGMNIEITNELRSYKANSFGYISIIDYKISILSPIIVADDDMTAWYISFPQHEPVRMPDFKDIVGLLKKSGVTRGIKEHPLKKFCHALEHGQVACWNVIARGQPPLPGENSRLAFSVDREKSSGKLREDGSIDLRELNLVQTVSSGAVIAVKHPPTEGTPGYTLSGEPLETESGEDLKVEAKENVRSEENEDGTTTFYAECDGLITYKGDNISIEPLYKISGNVDFSTGNVDVDCALEISGNICSDFTVKSTSDVLVGGNIEPGAILEIDGNLEVKGGIIGETTRITVLGNMKADFVQAGGGEAHQSLKTDFIQAAKIVVKGDLTVNQYIYYAVIKAVGKIIVGPGTGKRGGSIVGGVVCSSSGIKLSVCGSPSFVPTLLILEPTPTKLAKLRKLKENRKLCDATTTKIMRTLNVDSIEKETLTKLLASADEKQKKLYADLLTKLNTIIKDKQKILDDLDTLKKELYFDLSKMKIIVTRTYHGNTRLRIGKKEFLEKEDRAPSQFSFLKKLVHVEAIGAGDKETDIF